MLSNSMSLNKKRSSKRSNIQRSSSNSINTSLAQNKKRKLEPSPSPSPTDSEDLFEMPTFFSNDQISNYSSDDDEDDNSSSAADKNNQQPISKHDLRFNFSNILNQQIYSPHPSPLTIDLHTEMKLQRQRRLIQLELLRSNDMDDTDSLLSLFPSSADGEDNQNNENDSDSQLFDDYLNLSSSEDEELLEDSLPKFNYIKRIEINDSSCTYNDNLDSLTTGLEQVDRIIKQLNNANSEDEFLRLNDQIIVNHHNHDLAETSRNSNNKDSNFRNLTSSIEQKQQLKSTNETEKDGKNCHLISDTSSFHLLTNKRELFSKLKKKNEQVVLKRDDSSKQDVSIDEFLNLEEQEYAAAVSNHEESDSVESEESPLVSSAPSFDSDFVPLSHNSSELQTALSLSKFTKFDYRYNHDNINLALVDKMNYDAVNGKTKKKQGPLNRRALFYGNHSEMVNNDSSLCLNDFLI